jgi:cellulose synthase/poly-beta-1,6-N-acetylglucosamine synthase-like glycosyltransferase
MLADEGNAAGGEPFVSVIVPYFGTPAALQDCLAGLAAQTYPAGRFEVIVVNNGPGCALAGASLPTNVRIVAEPKPGSYAARNKGITEARGDVLAFTDADCRPTRGWLEEAVAALGGDESKVVAGRIEVTCRRPGRPNPFELYGIIFGHRQEYWVGQLSVASTGNLIVPRAVFDDVGPFDDSLFSGGDFEWSARAAASGHRLSYCEAAVVTTPARYTLGQHWARAARIAGGKRRSRGASAAHGGPPPEPADPVGNLIRVLRYPGAPLATRVLVPPLVLLLRIAAAWETVRLALGGQPRR